MYANIFSVHLDSAQRVIDAKTAAPNKIRISFRRFEIDSPSFKLQEV